MSDLTNADRIRDNWHNVCDDVQRAACESGRTADAVQIVGVSKYVDAATTSMLVDAGCHCLGESRPQALWQKAERLANHEIQWHMIGHLQRNKVRRLLKSCACIESVDSVRLLQAIAEESLLQDRVTRILLEVNISRDDAKTGLAPDQLAGLLESLPPAGIQVDGLMAMAGWGTEPREARKQFAETRQLRDRLVEQTGVALPQLSMGMSGDFREAIAEGATIVRIGSRLFTGVV
jgi:pyridoxal phosphate enzyme (YggS family)